MNAPAPAPVTFIPAAAWIARERAREAALQPSDFTDTDPDG